MPAHKHAELMALYAQDAMETDKPWEWWEWRWSHEVNCWHELVDNVVWRLDRSYRRKPRTIRIGEFDVPEPLRHEPAYGTKYWLASPDIKPFAHGIQWGDDGKDQLWLLRGLIHLTPEDAELHGRALVSLTEVK